MLQQDSIFIELSPPIETLEVYFNRITLLFSLAFHHFGFSVLLDTRCNTFNKRLIYPMLRRCNTFLPDVTGKRKSFLYECSFQVENLSVHYESKGWFWKKLLPSMVPGVPLTTLIDEFSSNYIIMEVVLRIVPMFSILSITEVCMYSIRPI
jgi:hypothetical protein